MNPEVTDVQWEVLRSLMPPHGRMGRPRADDRQTLNGILYVLRTGCRWEDLPKVYGHASTCWRRLRRWQEEGIWERLWQQMLSTLDERGRLEWERAFAWLGNFRRLLVRHERVLAVYHGFFILACVLIVLNRLLQ